MYTQGIINSTLVPLDFSDTSLLALDHAVNLANAIGDGNQTITLLHIIEGASFNAVSAGAQVDPSTRDFLAIEGAVNRLQKIVERFSKEKISFKYVVAGGKAYKKIVEMAEQLEINMIVMGTHGSSGIQAFAGSNASKVIQTAPCPVVVVKERPFGRGYENIVLPLDLSKETKQKVGFAAHMAKLFDATVHIITMHEDDEFLKKRVENNMKQVEKYLKERKIKNTTTTLQSSGNFPMQTLTWAQGKDADLIIIMTQQEKGMSEYIFGTYAQQIVNRSPVPVMTIQPRPELEGEIGSVTGTGSSF